MTSKACVIEADDDGSTRISHGDKEDKFFAYVQIVAGSGATKGQASWNGVAGASHAHDDLGILVRNDHREPAYCFHTPWDGPIRPAHYVTLCSMFPPEVVATGKSAIQFVSGLYDQLVASGEVLEDPLDKEINATNGHTLLEPALVLLSQRDGATHPDGPGIGVSLCNCQDGPITDVQVRAIAAEAGREVMEAKFKVGGAPRIMRLLLVGGGASDWQIADL